MGSGIAHAFAAASIDVILIDVASDLVAQGIKRIEGRCASDAKRGKLSLQAMGALMGLIKGSTAVEDAHSSDLVIEAIIEDRKIKGDLFRSLDRLCRPECVFATNTSSLSVTDLAFLSGRPDRFLGLHFFNPVHAMKLVEVIPGLDTADSVVSRSRDAMAAIGKVPIVAQDCPGFLVNRVLLMYITEALLAAEEGVSPEEIDAQAKEAGFPMGPLALVDMVGIDVSYHTQPILHEAYGVRFPFPQIVRRLFDAGRLGLKTGKGIYAEGKIDDEFRRIVGDRLDISLLHRAMHREGGERGNLLPPGRGCLRGRRSTGPWSSAPASRKAAPSTGPMPRGSTGSCRSSKILPEQKGPRFWPHHLLKTYVAGGRVGKKTKKGFFEYPHAGD